jgi:nucleotidyltransferase
MNKPVMTYGIELLKKYGIHTIGVTLQYLPNIIQDYYEDGLEYGVELHYFIEETPLGTAGSVKNAQSILDETFIVISGDALANINLSKALEFHKKNNSIATLILKRVEVPLEYGVVVTDEKGAITRFLEKPNWGEVFSDTVNTGIYILEPEVLDYLKAGEKFDFSQDLFPMLLKDKKPIYGYITDEYWCDIGDLQSYLQAHYDMMDGKVGFNVQAKQLAEKVWVGENTEIHPEAEIKGPCYLGNYNQIKKGAKILPYTVIGDYNYIGEGTSIKKSVLWNYNILGKNVEIRGAVLCNKNELKNNVCTFEGAVIGEGCQLHDYSKVNPNVKIWPEKVIEQRMVVQENLIWGTRYKKTLFGKDGIKGKFNTDITSSFMARLGAAFGAQLKEGKN